MSQTWTPNRRPLFTRVVDDIVEQIRDGRLRPGDRVPSTRELADFYGVASMTALRAMRELQVRGATDGVVGSGTFVRPDALTRLTTPAVSPGCRRCAAESAYTKRLITAINRCHRMAEQIESPAFDVMQLASEVRRLASVLAGEPLDRARHLDRCREGHYHSAQDEDDEDYEDDDLDDD